MRCKPQSHLSRYSLPLVSTLWLCSSSLRASEISVDLWVLSTGIHDSSTGQGDSEGTDVVQNPYLVTHQVSIPIGQGVTFHNLSWGEDSGGFLIDLTHALHDVPTHSAFVQSAGTIIFHSSSPLLIDLSAFYTYQGLGAEFSSLDVVDRTVSPQFHYLDFGETGGPVFLGAPSGTFATTLNAILPANHSFRVSYNFTLRTFAGGSSAVGTADGGLSFTLTAVPECATSTFFLVLATAALRRKRR